MKTLQHKNPRKITASASKHLELSPIDHRQSAVNLPSIKKMRSSFTSPANKSLITRNASLSQLDPSHSKKATFTAEEEEQLRKLIQS